MNKSINDRFAIAQARYGTTKAKDTKPAPKAKVTAKPTGGLKPSGIKIKWEKRF